MAFTCMALLVSVALLLPLSRKHAAAVPLSSASTPPSPPAAPAGGLLLHASCLRSVLSACPAVLPLAPVASETVLVLHARCFVNMAWALLRQYSPLSLPSFSRPVCQRQQCRFAQEDNGNNVDIAALHEDLCKAHAHVRLKVVEVAIDKGVPQVVARWGSQPTLCTAYSEDGSLWREKTADLLRILGALPKDRQTLLFSATVPDQVENICKIAMKNDYKYIDTVGEVDEETHVQVKQDYLIVPLENQLAVIYALLKQHAADEPNFKVLVFCTTARVTALLAELYKKLGLNTLEIHSRKSQAFRTKVSDDFRKHTGEVIMFTSDVSARGVDYPDVTLVLQVRIPSGREQYIHRLRRTGRAGKEGRGLLVLTPWEEVFLRSLKDITITQAMDVPISSDIEAKVNKALSYLSEDAKSKG